MKYLYALLRRPTEAESPSQSVEQREFLSITFLWFWFIIYDRIVARPGPLGGSFPVRNGTQAEKQKTHQQQVSKKAQWEIRMKSTQFLNCGALALLRRVFNLKLYEIYFHRTDMMLIPRRARGERIFNPVARAITQTIWRLKIFSSSPSSVVHSDTHSERCGVERDRIGLIGKSLLWMSLNEWEKRVKKTWFNFKILITMCIYYMYIKKSSIYPPTLMWNDGERWDVEVRRQQQTCNRNALVHKLRDH